MRPNDVAEWELRIGKFRVFYNVYDEQLIVSIEAVGFKIGNLIFMRGEKRNL
jgi:mRNA-degrading endonuclease RelE of RelBE toxin-antitoxin system